MGKPVTHTDHIPFKYGTIRAVSKWDGMDLVVKLSLVNDEKNISKLDAMLDDDKFCYNLLHYYELKPYTNGKIYNFDLIV